MHRADAHDLSALKLKAKRNCLVSQKPQLTHSQKRDCSKDGLEPSCQDGTILLNVVPRGPRKLAPVRARGPPARASESDRVKIVRESQRLALTSSLLQRQWAAANEVDLRHLESGLLP